MNSQPRVVSSNDAKPRIVDENMTISEYFTRADSEKADLVTTYLDGTHGRRVNHRSAKLYFALEGSLTAEIDGVTYEIDPYTAVLLPPGVPAALRGVKSKFLTICSPPFSPADESIE
jgi:mannose-6-phosphate isomerase-like protein (cupin superfamily)